MRVCGYPQGARVRLGWKLFSASLGTAFAFSAHFATAAEDRFTELRATAWLGVRGQSWQLVERARPTFESELSERWTLVATIEAGLRQGRDAARELQRTLEQSDLGPVLEEAGCRWEEPRNGTLRIDDSGDYLDVDRLYLDWYGRNADLRVGRQALHWGSGQFLNPTDPFPQVLLTEPWRPRRGVNAARLTLPFGALNDVTAVAALNDSLTKTRAAIRARVNAWETDFALVAAYRQDSEDGYVGLDMRGTFELGWWIEAALKVPDGARAYEQVVAGVDYSFPVLESLIVLAQYYRNGSGESDSLSSERGPGQLGSPGLTCVDPFAAALLGEQEPDPFAPFLLGRDYLMLGANLSATLETSLGVTALANLGDGSALVVPTLSHRFLDNFELAASAQLPLAAWGRGGELSPSDDDLRLELSSPLGPRLSLDLSGLAPDATFSLWTRGYF